MSWLGIYRMIFGYIYYTHQGKLRTLYQNLRYTTNYNLTTQSTRDTEFVYWIP